jgi:hypothetical protein
MFLKMISSSNGSFRSSKPVDQHSQATAVAALLGYMAVETKTMRRLAVVLAASFSNPPCNYFSILGLISETIHPMLYLFILFLFRPFAAFLKPDFSSLLVGMFLHPTFSCILYILVRLQPSFFITFTLYIEFK